MSQHGLGRKRFLDTRLATTDFSNTVHAILTTNARYFQVFGCFEVTVPYGLAKESLPQSFGS